MLSENFGALSLGEDAGGVCAPPAPQRVVFHVSASSVSAVAGRHRYRPDALEALAREIAERPSNAPLLRALEAAGGEAAGDEPASLESVAAAVHRAVAEIVLPAEALADDVSAPPPAVEAVQSAHVAAAVAAVSAIAPERSEAAAAIASGEWVRQRGTALEAGVLAKLAHLGKVEAPRTRGADVAGMPGVPIRLVGIADGVVYGPDGRALHVVEVKNRQRRFLAAEYDIDQLAAYQVLYRATGAGYLVEKANGEIRCTPHAPAALEARWAEVVGRLREVSERCAEVLADPRGELARKLAAYLVRAPPERPPAGRVPAQKRLRP